MHFTLCDLITDITQNSVEANAQEIEVQFLETSTELSAIITDNGIGMGPEKLKIIQDPFYTNGKKHLKRKIGMGIPFLIQTAEDTNGNWNIKSKKGKGTTVSMRFDLTNIDTPPIGDVSELFRQLFMLPGIHEMTIIRKRTGLAPLDYLLVRSQIIDAIGDLENVKNLALLGLYLKSQESSETSIPTN